jgi:plastocyanin
MRRRLLLPVLALLGASVVTLPAVAGSETSPTITAENIGGGVYGEEHRWSPAQATIAPGGAVTLSNPTEVKHGVRWVNGPATPSCDGGVPVGTTAADSNTNWSGSCTFTAAGVYTFYCTVHGAAMAGHITVGAGETTTTGTTTTTPTTAAPGIGAGTSGPSGAAAPGASNALGSGGSSPFLGSAARALKLAANQRGRSVRGSVAVSQAGAHGSLEVDLLARSASLARAGHSAQVRVGRVVRSSLSAGTARFSVPLNRRAKAALARKGRLALSVKVVLKPAGGSPVSLTRGVVLHE